uniref:TRAP transporter large permease n=1 Tax=Roseovarius indicus TaxID=540747 RepID=UPI003B51F66B
MVVAATAALAFFAFCLLASVPVFVGMGLTAMLGTWVAEGTLGLQDMALGAYNALNSFVLLAVPLYILAGTLSEESGLSDRLFSFATTVTSGLRGGLGIATILACAIFAAISGSSVATAATIGLVAIPALAKNGFSLPRAGALIAGGGTLGILIPPSIGLLLYGVLTDQSIGKLFIAGLMPGLVLVIIMALFVVVTQRNAPAAKAPDLRTLMREFVLALPILGLPALILVMIYTGIATATEVAALAVVYVTVLGYGLGNLSLKRLYRAGLHAAQTTVMILMLVAFGALMTHFMTLTRIPQGITEMIADSGLGFFGTITLMVLAFLVLGMFLEALSMMLITIPILFPVAMSLGIDPIAFGIFVVLAIEVAQITPPVGINLFTVAKIGGIRFEQMAKSIVPYVLLMILMMYAVAYFQGLATWLPNTME